MKGLIKKALSKKDQVKIDEAKKITRVVEITKCAECKNFRFHHIPQGGVCQCAANMGAMYVLFSQGVVDEFFRTCGIHPVIEK